MNMIQHCTTCRHWPGRRVTSVPWGTPLLCNTDSHETCADWSSKDIWQSSARFYADLARTTPRHDQ